MCANLKLALQIEGLTQAELSRRASLSRSTVSRALRGARQLSPAAQARIAKTLGRRVEDLFRPEESGR